MRCSMRKTCLLRIDINYINNLIIIPPLSIFFKKSPLNKKNYTLYSKIFIPYSYLIKERLRIIYKMF